MLTKLAEGPYPSVLPMIPVVLHAIGIMGLNGLYRHVAEWLTELENHQTDRDHNNSLIVKRILFEAFDCYIGLFYLAFCQFDIVGLRNDLFGLCVRYTVQQYYSTYMYIYVHVLYCVLQIISCFHVRCVCARYTTDSLRRLATESVIPWVVNKWEERDIEKPGKVHASSSDTSKKETQKDKEKNASSKKKKKNKNKSNSLASKPDGGSGVGSDDEGKDDAPVNANITADSATLQVTTTTSNSSMKMMLQLEYTLDEYEPFDDFLEMVRAVKCLTT